MKTLAERRVDLTIHRSNMFTEFVEHLVAFSDATEAGDIEEANNQFAHLCNMYKKALYKKA